MPIKFASLRNLSDRLAALWRDDRGAIAIIAAVMLPMVVGAVGLGAEYGNSLVVKAQNQRVADLASYAGALAYQPALSTTAAQAAAQRLAALNGIAAADVTTTVTTSPTNPANSAVHVVVATGNSLLLSPVIGDQDFLTIASEAYTAFTPASGGTGTTPSDCILALNASQTGLTMSGGVHVTATSCDVASNASINIQNCGITITSPRVVYGTSAPSGCTGGISGTVTGPTTTTDPLSAHAGIATATARIAGVSSLASPAAPAAPVMGTAPTGGVSIDFAWNTSTTDANGPYKQAQALGCTAPIPGGDNTWVLTCPRGTPTKVYNFAGITIGGGRNLTIQTSGSGTATFNFSGAMNVASGPTFKMLANNADGTGGTGVTYNFGSTFTTGGTTSNALDGNYNFFGNFVHNTGTTTLRAGLYKFGGNLSAQSSGTFALGSGSPTVAGTNVYNVAGEIYVSGSAAATFGGGTYNVVRGLRVEGGNNPVFGAGAFSLGTSLIDCNASAGKVSICNNSTSLTFGGPSTFSLSAGIYNNGGSTLTMGSGTTNSYNIGASTLGNALTLGGGSKTVMADASSGLFQLGGHLVGGGGGGSCLRIPAAPQHDIKGNFTAAGGVWLGPGPYTVSGYMSLGATAGGAVSCPSILASGNLSVYGEGVTIILGGSTLPTAGSCLGMAFCVGAGYSGVTLSAPGGTTNPLASVVIVGPKSTTNTAGALFTEGGSNGKFAGAFYFPNGPISMSGGAGVSGGDGCLQLIGSRITMNGGTTLASKCTFVGNPSTTVTPIVAAVLNLVQ